MTADEMKSLLESQLKDFGSAYAKSEDVAKQLKAIEDKLPTMDVKSMSDSLAKLEEIATKQGEMITAMKSDAGLPKKDIIKEALTAKKDEISGIQSRKGQVIDLLEVKAVADVTLANGSLTSALSSLYGVINSDEVNDIRLRSPFIEEFATVTSTNKGTFSYTDFKPKEGDVTDVLEGASKPQLDFTWVTTPLTPVKAAGYEVLSDESLTDIPQLEGIAKDYLLRKYLLKRQSTILDTVIASAPAFSAATWTGTKKATPNLYDAIVACTNQIQTAANYTDDVEFNPNVCFLNPADLNALRIKQSADNYVFPQLNSMSEGTVNGIRLVAKSSIPAGKILIGDFTKLNVVNYVNYAVSMGWINDQYIKNMITMLGEGRFYNYIRTLDKLAFVYDDIADVIAGITVAP